MLFSQNIPPSPPTESKSLFYPSVSLIDFVVVQSLSSFWLWETPWTVAQQASLSFTISHSLLKLMSTELLTLIEVFIFISSV